MDPSDEFAASLWIVRQAAKVYLKKPGPFVDKLASRLR